LFKRACCSTSVAQLEFANNTKRCLQLFFKSCSLLSPLKNVCDQHVKRPNNFVRAFFWIRGQSFLVFLPNSQRPIAGHL
jgi:hypothetical protein